MGTATSNSVKVIKAELKEFNRKPVATIYAQEGKPFQLFCDAPTGWPKPSVSWVKKVNTLKLVFIWNTFNEKVIIVSGIDGQIHRTIRKIFHNCRR